MSPEQRLASHQDGGPALANFVRTFELNSNISSHDWHVQPSCQRPNSRDPPERRLFSPVRNESDRPRNLLKLPILLLACQRIGITGFTQVIHSSSTAAAKAAQELARPARLKPCPSQTLPSSTQTEILEQQNASPALLCRRLKASGSARAHPARALKPQQGGRFKNQKRSIQEVFANTAKPFEDRCPRM